MMQKLLLQNLKKLALKSKLNKFVFKRQNQILILSFYIENPLVIKQVGFSI